MKALARLYRFKTPFFRLEEEKHHLEGLYLKTKDFLSFQGIDFEEQTSENEAYKFFVLQAGDTFQITFSLTKNLSISYLPMLLIDLAWDEYTFQNEEVKKHFLEGFFEYFDGKSEKNYLVSFHHQNSWFRHDFHNIEILAWKYQDQKKMESIIETYLAKKDPSLKAYKEMEEVLLYFSSLVYFLIKNLSKIEYAQNLQEDLLGSEALLIEYETTLKLSQNRLTHLKDINIITAKRYIALMDTFYELFERRNER